MKHLVHTSKDKGYLVLAVFYKEGEENTSFDFLESYLPLNKEEQKAIGKAYNFKNDLPSKFDHYAYTESLTPPPCTEGVHWFLFKETETITKDQAKAISDLMPINNFRPTQPTNGREITLSQ